MTIHGAILELGAWRRALPWRPGPSPQQLEHPNGG